MKATALAPDTGSSTMVKPNQKRTGMEPFFDFLNAILYAFVQIRIEWQAYKSYRRDIPQGVSL